MANAPAPSIGGDAWTFTPALLSWCPLNGTFIGRQTLGYDPGAMDRPEPPARVPVSADWLAEQERKQAAYAAARRARSTSWEGERQAEPAVEEEPPPSPALPASAPSAPSAGRRPRGPIIDPRQSRFF